MVGIEPLVCPRKRCKGAQLRTNVALPQCPVCLGVWIPERVLHDRIQQMRRQPPRLEWRREARAAVMCLACGERMDTLVLYDVPVDRCRGHGIWLDGGELEHVLFVCQQQRPYRDDSIAIDLVADVAGTAAEIVVETAAVDAMTRSRPELDGDGDVDVDVPAPAALGAAVAVDTSPADAGIGTGGTGGTGAMEATSDVASAAADGTAAAAEAGGGALEVVGDVLGAVGSGTVEVLGAVGKGLVEVPGALLEGLGSILDF